MIRVRKESPNKTIGYRFHSIYCSLNCLSLFWIARNSSPNKNVDAINLQRINFVYFVCVNLLYAITQIHERFMVAFLCVCFCPFIDCICCFINYVRMLRCCVLLCWMLNVDSHSSLPILASRKSFRQVNSVNQQSNLLLSFMAHGI